MVFDTDKAKQNVVCICCLEVEELYVIYILVCSVCVIASDPRTEQSIRTPSHTFSHVYLK